MSVSHCHSLLTLHAQRLMCLAPGVGFYHWILKGIKAALSANFILTIAHKTMCNVKMVAYGDKLEDYYPTATAHSTIQGIF